MAREGESIGLDLLYCGRGLADLSDNDLVEGEVLSFDHFRADSRSSQAQFVQTATDDGGPFPSASFPAQNPAQHRRLPALLVEPQGQSMMRLFDQVELAGKHNPSAA